MAETREIQKTDAGLPQRVPGANDFIGQPPERQPAGLPRQMTGNNEAPRTSPFTEVAAPQHEATESELPPHLQTAARWDTMLEQNPLKMEAIAHGKDPNPNAVDALRRREIRDAQEKQHGRHHMSPSEQLKQLRRELNQPLDLPKVQTDTQELIESNNKRNQT